MSASGPLELAIALIKEHQASRGAEPQLISVLDSELDRNHEIYDAVMRRVGGTYISVDKATDSRGMGTLDTELRDVIKEGLRLSPLALEIEIEQEGEYVAVRRSDGVDPVNDSERLILSFVFSLFSQDLEGHSVAVISWTETRLEFLARQALWQLIRAQVGGRRLRSVTTLVFIAGGHVDPEIHCEHEVSVRFALTERGLSTRKGRVSLRTAVGKLVRDSENLFVLFLGAGASASANMPLGNDARDFALEKFCGDAVPAPLSELAARFLRWIRENGRMLAGEENLDVEGFVERLTLERVLREEFRRDGRDQSPTLRYLVKRNKEALERKKTGVRRALRTIFAKTHKLAIVTVNFDTILEDEFGPDLRTFVTKSDFDSARGYIQRYLEFGGAVPVLKLHGSLDSPASIVADIDTRSLGLASGATEALQLLRGTTNQQRVPWVYIGASMRDPDVTQVIGSSDFAEGLDEWWVSPFPDPAVFQFVDEHRSSRWQKAERPSLAERQITETAETFLALLSRSWPSRS